MYFTQGCAEDVHTYYKSAWKGNILKPVIEMFVFQNKGTNIIIFKFIKKKCNLIKSACSGFKGLHHKHLFGFGLQKYIFYLG